MPPVFFTLYLRSPRTVIVTLAIRGSAHANGYSQDANLISALPFTLMRGYRIRNHGKKIRRKLQD